MRQVGLQNIANAPPPPPLSKMPLPDQRIAEANVKKFLSTRLPDPESTRYEFKRPVRGTVLVFGRSHSAVFMCGIMNAKNLMGGYTGRKPFLAEFDPIVKNKVVDFLADADEPCDQLYGSWM